MLVCEAVARVEVRVNFALDATEALLDAVPEESDREYQEVEHDQVDRLAEPLIGFGNIIYFDAGEDEAQDREETLLCADEHLFPVFII